MDEAIKSKIERLLDGIETREVDPFSNDEPVRVIHLLGDLLVLRGEALEILDDLKERLARPALREGGPSPSAVDKMLIDACVKAATNEPNPIDHLREEIERSPQEWLVADQLPTYRPLKRNLEIGSCQLVGKVPQLIAQAFRFDDLEERFGGGALVTTVKARDEHSARQVAHDRFEETRAILNLIGSRGPDSPALGAIRIDGPGGSLSHPDKREVFSMQLVNEDGSLHPGYAELSIAAAKHDDQRSDWEQRCLAAARWYLVGSRSVWPSAILTACITSLECLVLAGSEEDKGKEVAEMVGRLLKRRGMTQSKLRRWIRNLYSRRNEVVHAGRDFRDELDAERLLPVVYTLIRWSLSHLTEFHRDYIGGPRGPCETYDEVMGHAFAKS